jgi:hypothetical protein
MLAPYSVAGVAGEIGRRRRSRKERGAQRRGGGGGAEERGLGTAVRGVKKEERLMCGLHRWVVGMKEKYEGR